MKLTKKNIAFLSTIATCTMVTGSLLAEDTFIVPSLLADRKRSDTLTVSISTGPTRSVSLEDTPAMLAPQSLQSISPSFLEEIALLSVASHVDVSADEPEAEEALLSVVPDVLEIARDEIPSFRSVERASDDSLNEVQEVAENDREINSLELPEIDFHETLIRSLDLGFIDNALPTALPSAPENVMQSSVQKDERNISQDVAVHVEEVSKSSSSEPKKMQLKIKAPPSAATSTRMQKLLEIIGQRS